MLDGSQNNEVLSPGTKTVLSNESLSEGLNKFMSLTELTDFSGRSLGITEDSSLEISYVMQGKTHVLTLNPVKDTAVQDMVSSSDSVDGADPTIVMDVTINSTVGTDRVGNSVSTIKGNKALLFTSKSAGLDGQISGLTFNVRNSDGTINRTANSILNNFDVQMETSWAEINAAELIASATTHPVKEPVQYQLIKKDLTLELDSLATFAEASSQLEGLVKGVEFKSEFTSKELNSASKKRITLGLTLDLGPNPKAKEINLLLERCADKLQGVGNAKVV